ncbi:nucleoside diphosphate kinase 7-like [Amphibalanus amphitrite]|uniref:nucleoside diphosphate kinase 7-like n=1 Tax=Amphibalanus amphitrite TaxID=1232801 RepID=UPI001C8FB4DF|nr:nucleoside diphosphate kinase 7-like [Amphibalanus amphitrite]
MPPFQPASQDRVAFNAEWYDPESSLTRDMVLYFYTEDSSVELFDRRTNRTYLKRTQVPTVTCSDLALGNLVTVLGRHMRLVEYANKKTRDIFEDDSQSTLALVKPAAVQHLGKIVQIIEKQGLRVTRARMVQLERHEAGVFFSEAQQHCQAAEELAYLTAGPCVVLQLTGQDAVQRWRELMGPTDCLTASEECCDTVRRQLGAELDNNCLHGSTGCEAAVRELRFFFPPAGDARPLTSARLSADGSCCVILPHVLAERRLGDVLAAIQADHRVTVTALDMMTLTGAEASRLLEVYRGVLPECGKMIAQLSSGPSVALELSGAVEGQDTVEVVRELAGPRDPHLAQLLRPDSLRAKFGRDTICNAVYCTDLPEDSLMDREYLFRILQPC